MTRRDTYHHGDLRNALLSATIELVHEHGARGFSVSAAARRAGVSLSAPYRHFADRDAMLAAAAQHGFTELETRFTALALGSTFAARAAQIAVAYVEFAREDPARFEVMFASGIDKSLHPDLLEQTHRIQSRLEGALSEYMPRSESVDRAAELWAIAHGVASLTVSENLHHVIDRRRIDTIAASAARTWASGIAGHDASEIAAPSP